MITVKSELTVVGGGVAGITAALTAARCGLKVALVQDREVLGGNMSSECQVGYGSGAINKSYYARESGISDELKMRLYNANPRFHDKEEYYLIDDTLFEIVMEEPNISLFLGCAVDSVECEDGFIKSVSGFCARTQTHYTFEGPLFVDASGDGIVGFKSGAEFKMGREAKSEYGESLAPDEADMGCMGSCILFNVAKADREIPFKKPAFAYDYQKDDILKYANRPETGRELPTSFDGMTGLWWLSYAADGDTVKKSYDIDTELKKLVYGYWDYVKNSGKFENTENYYLRWIAPFASKRESRRFIGDYVLTQNDVQNCVYHYDDISTGGWSIDCHDPKGVYGEGKTSIFGSVPKMYNIPYRITYSKNIKNLFLAGRIVSASHLALGSLRVMQTLSAMAQAAGTAAYLCRKYNCLPHDVSERYVKELQTILQYNGQYIIGKSEDCGLASKAKIYASSERTLENTFCDVEIPFKYNICLILPTESGHIDSVELLVKNNSAEDVPLQLSMYDSPCMHEYTPRRLLKNDKLIIPTGNSSWIKVDINLSGIEGGNLYLVLNRDERLTVVGSHHHITGAPTFGIWGNELWRTDFTLAFKKLTPDENLYAAKNTVNGISRPCGLPNMWTACGVNGEKITFEFDSKETVSEVQLVFNSELYKDYFEPDVQVKQLVKCFVIRLYNGEEQVAVKEVTDNCVPLARSYFDKISTDKIEVEIKANYGSPFAEVFAVKIF